MKRKKDGSEKSNPPTHTQLGRKLGKGGPRGKYRKYLSNILQSTAQTTYQWPSPARPAVPRLSHATETDRFVPPSRLQTPHWAQAGWEEWMAVWAAYRLSCLGTQSWVQSKPQRETMGLSPKAKDPTLPTRLGPCSFTRLLATGAVTQAVTWAQTFNEHTSC